MPFRARKEGDPAYGVLTHVYMQWEAGLIHWYGDITAVKHKSHTLLCNKETLHCKCTIILYYIASQRNGFLEVKKSKVALWLSKTSGYIISSAGRGSWGWYFQWRGKITVGNARHDFAARNEKKVCFNKTFLAVLFSQQKGCKFFIYSFMTSYSKIFWDELFLSWFCLKLQKYSHLVTVTSIWQETEFHFIEKRGIN